MIRRGDHRPRRRPAFPSRIGWVALLLAAGVTSPAAGHEHHPRTPIDSARLDSLLVDSMRIDSATGGALVVRRRPAFTPRDTFMMPGVGQALVEHVHNKIVHFPIVLTLVGLTLLVAARGRPALEPAARATIWATAASAVAAYFSGLGQRGAFDDTPKRWLVEVHRWWGTGTGTGMVLWAALATWRPARKWVLPWGILVALAVLVTAYFGGIISHAE